MSGLKSLEKLRQPRSISIEGLERLSKSQGRQDNAGRQHSAVDRLHLTKGGLLEKLDKLCPSPLANDGTTTQSRAEGATKRGKMEHRV